MQRLLSLFLAFLTSDKKTAIEPIEVSGTPNDVERMIPRDVGDSLATFGWQVKDGKVTLFVTFVIGFIATAITAIAMRFNKEVDHAFGAISRTQIGGGKVMTVVSTTSDAYGKNPMIFSALVARLARLADFDGVYRASGSNVLNLATNKPTNELYMVAPNGVTTKLPEIPGTTMDDTIVHAVDPTNGVVLLAKRGDTTIYTVDLDNLVTDGSLEITKVLNTKSPIEDISAYDLRTAGFYITTRRGIEIISAKGDKGYERTSEEIVDGIDGFTLLGVSAGGGLNVTKRDTTGGKTTVYVVPKTFDGQTVRIFETDKANGTGLETGANT